MGGPVEVAGDQLRAIVERIEHVEEEMGPRLPIVGGHDQATPIRGHDHPGDRSRSVLPFCAWPVTPNGNGPASPTRRRFLPRPRWRLEMHHRSFRMIAVRALEGAYIVTRRMRIDACKHHCRSALGARWTGDCP
jgi:hypothetical protein